ncbi:hypothetical protein AAMO2058_001303700 [Amorphochlora amoebiformis]
MIDISEHHCNEKKSGKKGGAGNAQDASQRTSPAVISKSRSNVSLERKLGARVDAESTGKKYAKEASKYAETNSKIERKIDRKKSPRDVRIARLQADFRIRSHVQATIQQTREMVTTLQNLAAEVAQDQNAHDRPRINEIVGELKHISTSFEDCGRKYINTIEVFFVHFSKSGEELIDNTDIMLRQVDNFVTLPEEYGSVPENHVTVPEDYVSVAETTKGIVRRLSALQRNLARIREEILDVQSHIANSPSEWREMKPLTQFLPNIEIKLKVLGFTTSVLKLCFSSSPETPPNSPPLFNASFNTPGLGVHVSIPDPNEHLLALLERADEKGVALQREISSWRNNIAISTAELEVCLLQHATLRPQDTGGGRETTGKSKDEKS